MAKDPLPRGLRDEATVGPDPSRARPLTRLSKLRYEVAEGEPDAVVADPRVVEAYLGSRGRHAAAA